MIEYANGPLSPEGQARLHKYGSTLTDDNVQRLIARIVDYPEIVAAAARVVTPEPVADDRARVIAESERRVRIPSVLLFEAVEKVLAADSAWDGGPPNPAEPLGRAISDLRRLWVCACGCPPDMHIGEIGCPCGLPDDPPCTPATEHTGDRS